jgi:hypothetical protein
MWQGMVFAAAIALAGLLLADRNLLRCNCGPRRGIWSLRPGRKRRERRLRIVQAILFGVLCAWLVYSHGRPAKQAQPADVTGRQLLMRAN